MFKNYYLLHDLFEKSCFKNETEKLSSWKNCFRLKKCATYVIACLQYLLWIQMRLKKLFFAGWFVHNINSVSFSLLLLSFITSSALSPCQNQKTHLVEKFMHEITLFFRNSSRKHSQVTDSMFSHAKLHLHKNSPKYISITSTAKPEIFIPLHNSELSTKWYIVPE